MTAIPFSHRLMVPVLALMIAISTIVLPSRALAQEQPKRGGTLKVVKGGLPPGASHFENYEGIWLTTATGEQGLPTTMLAAAAVMVLIVVAGGFLAIRRIRSA